MVLYECKYCNLKTYNKKNYEKHITTLKHKKNIKYNNLSYNDNNDNKNDNKNDKLSQKLSFNENKLSQKLSLNDN